MQEADGGGGRPDADAAMLDAARAESMRTLEQSALDVARAESLRTLEQSALEAAVAESRRLAELAQFREAHECELALAQSRAEQRARRQLQHTG